MTDIAPPDETEIDPAEVDVSDGVVIEVRQGAAVELPLERARWQVTNFTDRQIKDFVAVLNEVEEAR